MSFNPSFEASFENFLAIGQFANAFTHPQLFATNYSGNDTFFQDVTLISAILFPTGILMGFSLMLIRRWMLPFGAMTAIWFGNSLLMLVLNSDQALPYALILLAPLFAGLTGDILLAKLQASKSSVVLVRGFGFLLPFVLFLLMFLILFGFYQGIWWRIHLWLGVSFVAGIFGLGLTYLLLPPKSPARSAWFEQM